jgi:hypothetical protein
MEQNRFLREFINMRKTINANPTTTKPSGMNALVNPNLTKSAPSLLPTGHSDTKPVKAGDITYKKIVEEKCPKSDVMKYLRERIDELKPLYDA